MKYTEIVKHLRSAGYPYRIVGNGGYEAVLVGIQPLNDGDFMAVYRYPGGDACHDLEEIRESCKIVEK
jgi:hypothetical protein